jgi:hypothetical protein
MERQLSDLLGINNSFSVKGGEIGTWTDTQTGLSYSGRKRKATDVAVSSQVGQQKDLSRNPSPTNPTTTTPTSPIIAGGNTQLTTQNPTIDLKQFETNDPLRKFNLALMDMLKKAQTGETAMSQEKAQLKREAYRSGQEVFTGDESKMTPEAKMATLNRNVEMFNPSIEAATTKIKQLKDITDLMKTTYGEDFYKMLPATEEDAQTFKLALQAGMTLPADILEKYKKFFTTEDFASWAEANKKGETSYQPPNSYQEWALAGGEAGTGKTYAEFIQTQKTPTAAQETTALYANRLEQAESIFNQLEKYVSGLSTFDLYAQKKLPNWARSSEYQSLDQAQRNFVNATLRRESGAVISPQEFENAEKQYFPQPGDTANTLKQKKLNRQQIIAGFISGSGNAYTPSEYLSGQDNIINKSDGTQWQQNADGSYTRIK